MLKISHRNKKFKLKDKASDQVAAEDLEVVTVVEGFHRARIRSRLGQWRHTETSGSNHKDHEQTRVNCAVCVQFQLLVAL
jgi:hypothetical protein